MSNTVNNYLSNFKNINEDSKSELILAFVFIIFIIFCCYMIYYNMLRGSECKSMNNIYSNVNGYIKPISANDPDCSGNLYDYYIKTAYNACSGGSYKNDFVDICNLKSIIKQGVRCLDFEIYSVNNEPIVSTSTTDSYYIKETFNSVSFSDVMTTINSYAFSGGSCSNSTDPLIIHLRIKSNNQEMYSKLANIFKLYDDIMLGKEYSFENSGKNLGNTPLLEFQKKIILIVDKTNNAFLENKDFLEYVNLTSNSMFVRSYHYYDIKNNPDVKELAEYNKRSMTIVMPDIGINPSNPSGYLCRNYGCQMVAMRFQYIDNYLTENTLFFDKHKYAFALKPLRLRYSPVVIPDPVPQNPNYSYGTRNVATDYYNFNY